MFPLIPGAGCIPETEKDLNLLPPSRNLETPFPSRAMIEGVIIGGCEQVQSVWHTKTQCYVLYMLYSVL